MNMKKAVNNPTLLGTVQDVNGTSISVTLNSNQLSGLTFVNGQGYRIGQLGTFVRIPIGYIDLFGIVSQVGASAVPENLAANSPYGNRWLTIQLIGEGYRKGNFQRGISQYPTIDDEVHLVSEEDLANIYGEQKKQNHLVRIGHVAGSESIDALIDINKLVTRHSAIVGTTGSGKSTTVAGLLNALSDSTKFPSARIIVLDIHGEYGNALKDRANIYKINPETTSTTEKPLHIPYWALSVDELVEITFGNFGDNHKTKNVIIERITQLKQEAFEKLDAANREGIAKENINADSPIPFSIHALWYELYCREFATYFSANDNPPIEANWAYELDSSSNPIKGDAIKGIPPRFRKPKNIKADTEKINYLPDGLNMRSQLENLGAKIRISRFDFLFSPGDWKPTLEGKVTKDLDKLVKDWIGSEKPITILDLSGVPTTLTNNIVGILLRILYDGLFWSRNLKEGGRLRPLLLVMEEAHSYLNDNIQGVASSIVQRIVKEGRKYGIGAMIVSQRPSEINPTILSQCGTFFAMRLSNHTDRSHITGAITDNLEGLTNMLPILRTGEALILGEAVKLPMRTMIEAPAKDKRPDSQDPIVCDEQIDLDKKFSQGGWSNPLQVDTDYLPFISTWRRQSPIVSKQLNTDKMEHFSAFESSNISLLSYDAASETLQVTFHNGGAYQYFDVSANKWDDFKRADSKGQFLHQQIKDQHRFVKM
ncbi:MAG: ATPase [Sphingobacteriia bacterium RIFOXYD2_FULL_35_12]|nr:MAG: ATPase [Sphingobacteriia bacterium RIFOXYC2_FULL_35_18]OHC89201.1 MAG: ATPase [Sphingobacteriia bacterium RIFOXYD2_FULL_35_12]